MGYRYPGTHVRLRAKLATKNWVWELVTEDGHIAAVSDEFGDRDACEAEGRAQDLPVVGGRKFRTAAACQRRHPDGCRIYNNGTGIWKWERIDSGTVVDASPTGFLTREECEVDWQRRQQCVVTNN